jgi:hypothetical protein
MVSCTLLKLAKEKQKMDVGYRGIQHLRNTQDFPRISKSEEGELPNSKYHLKKLR